jgi:hypothetical protein
MPVITGPTGVGKTTLIGHLKKRLTERFADEMKADPGTIPFLVVEAPASESGNFNWADFYLRILDAMQEPQVNFKVAPTELGTVPAYHRSGKSVHELRRLVEQSFFYRRSKILIVDEAQHILRMANGRRLRDQMTCLKSLASLSKVKVVMAGSYELVSIIEIDAHLARRVRIIHFPRYKADLRAEQQIFISVIATFQNALPMASDESLVTHWPLLYEGSLGCVGILKCWLIDAIQHAAQHRRPGITAADLEATKFAPASLFQMAEEISIRETELREQDARGGKVKEMLGLVQSLPISKQPRPSFSRPVGMRKPSLDVVGVPAGAQ